MINNWLLTSYKKELPDDFENQVVKKSPSNIALVKYWGKHGNQLPNNPSISFTLTNCFTETKISFCKSSQQKIEFLFEGKETPSFKTKIEKFFKENESFFPFLNQLEMKIESYNSFPHSSGIASSASSMSALVMCLLEIERICINDLKPIDLRKASYFSRLASGSASRSVFPVMALWGQTPDIQNSSDEYAVPLGDFVNPIFKSYHDNILIVSSKEKSVSSRVGHSLMDNHPEAEKRYATARKNTSHLLNILQSNDIEEFIKITESEALQLHELMATSNPPYKLIEENTVKILNAIRLYREETKIPVCFTLDAGPNVHLLFPESYTKNVNDFVDNVLKQYCNEGKYIEDQVSNE